MPGAGQRRRASRALATAAEHQPVIGDRPKQQRRRDRGQQLGEIAVVPLRLGLIPLGLVPRETTITGGMGSSWGARQAGRMGPAPYPGR